MLTFEAFSKQDIRFLSCAYKFGQVLAVVPDYDFERIIQKKPSCFRKLQASTYLFIILVGTGYSLSFRYWEFANLYHVTHLVLDYINEFLHIACVTIAIISAHFWHGEQWLRMNNFLQCIDKALKNRGRRIGSFYQNANLQLGLFFGIFLSVNTYASYFWTKSLGWSAASSYVIHIACDFFDMLLHFLIFNLALAFRSRYQDINKLLESEHVSAYQNRWHSNFGHLFREIGTFTRIMSEAVQEFNAYYGFTLVFMCGRSVVQTLVSLTFMINKVPINDANFKRDLFISNAIIAIVKLACSFGLSLSCDSVSRQSCRTAVLCFKLQEQLPEKSEARTDLFYLSQQASANVTKISAAGFFEINRGTFFGILATMTTYLIVIIQFSGTK